MAISQANVARLQQLISVSLKQGAGIRTIVGRMKDAADGIYRPRGYSEFENKVAYLVKAIGGPRLLYAMNHAHLLPSGRTARRHINPPELLPSIAEPTETEISTNISCSFGPSMPSANEACEHSLLIDGISLDEGAPYLRSSNSIVGFCREHAGSCDLRVQSLDTVKQGKDAVHNGAIHFGKEATVATIAPFRKDNYTAIPIFVSPTCKAETAPEMCLWLNMILEEWKRNNPDGEL